MSSQRKFFNYLIIRNGIKFFFDANNNDILFCFAEQQIVYIFHDKRIR